MPIYRVRKYSDLNLVKAGGNAPDTAGIGVVPFANSNAPSRGGAAGIVSISADGSTQQDLYDGNWRTKSGLTNSSANIVATIAVPNGSFASGNIEYCVEVSDGTDFQTISSFVTYGIVNKAGTFTTTITELSTNQAKAVSAGTLTSTWTITTSGTTATIKYQPASSLTPTTNRINFFISPFNGVVSLP